MNWREVPLQLFGPRALYCWLFHHWGNIEPASRGALRQLYQQRVGSRASSPERLVELATASEYERVLAALTRTDLELFVEWCLNEEEWPFVRSRLGILLSSSDLDIQLEELRQLLMVAFARERIWPRQGFRPLVQEALEAVNQANDALDLAYPNIALPRRLQAIQRVHDGLDRSLLCAERLLDLLVEFLSLTLLNLGWVSEEESDPWLTAVGVLAPKRQKEERSREWGNKQRILGSDIGRTFWEIELRERRTEIERRIGIEGQNDQRIEVEERIEPEEQKTFREPPDGWETIWLELRRLVELCGFEQRSDGKWYATGALMKLLDEMREYRNIVRHAPHTLRESRHVPEAYAEATPRIRDTLQRLWESIAVEPAVPQVAKVLEISGDCYGGSEITLALETRRIAVARYVHESDQSLLANGVEDGLALAQTEFEFFLFPSPTQEQSLIVNPSLLRREYNSRDLGSVGIKEEILARLREEQEAVKEAPPEEVIEKM